MCGEDRWHQYEEIDPTTEEIGHEYHIEKYNTEIVTKFPEIVCNEAYYVNVLWT